MIETTTKDFRTFNHEEFSIYHDGDELTNGGVNLLNDYLKSCIQSGEIFRPEETIQFGWMVLKIKRLTDVYLTLYEPDMHSFPIVWVRNVSNSIMHWRIQKFVADSVGLTEKMAFPSIFQSMIICKNVFNTNEFLLARDTVKQDDSGWFVGCTNTDCEHNNPENLSRVSLYRMFIDFPRLMMFYALPPESMVIYSGPDKIKVFYYDIELKFDKESLLDIVSNRDLLVL